MTTRSSKGKKPGGQSAQGTALKLTAPKPLPIEKKPLRWWIFFILAVAAGNFLCLIIPIIILISLLN